MEAAQRLQAKTFVLVHSTTIAFWQSGPSFLETFCLDTRTRGRASANSTLPNGAGCGTTGRQQRDVTATVRELCGKGLLGAPVGALGALARAESGVSKSLQYRVLERCALQRNLLPGKRVHGSFVRIGTRDSIAFLANHILLVYASQGRIQEALEAFSKVAALDAFMWSSQFVLVKPGRNLAWQAHMRGCTFAHLLWGTKWLEGSEYEYAVDGGSRKAGMRHKLSWCCHCLRSRRNMKAVDMLRSKVVCMPTLKHVRGHTASSHHESAHVAGLLRIRQDNLKD